ncbi:hypothetical protein [Nocardia asiatica]|uniref:hypothetical protein n=1 Tax=Nocardia asiatica TaxID=209252 RepID=UPI00245910FD|nr:hypothetical protein [Nocardia asiatica]
MNSETDSTAPERAVMAHPMHAAWAIDTARTAAGKAPMDGSASIAEAGLGAEGMAALRLACNAVGVPVPNYFDEAEWFPISALATAAPEFRPSREDVAKWCADNGVSDPHAAYDQLVTDRETAREVERSRYATVSPASGDSLRAVLAANTDLFDSSPQLRHIARFAHARGGGAWATLGGVLMRTVLGVPYTVVLPPIIGGEMSLNQLVIFAGNSGGGKDIAQAVSTAAVRYLVNGQPKAWPSLQPGTGEGLNRTFARGATRDKRPVVEFHTRTALFGFRDVAAFEKVSARQGATLIPELLKAAHGQDLGFANADTERRVLLPPHSYRLCLSMGVQPGNGGSLLNEQAERDGLPQRLLWLPVRDGRNSKGQVQPDAPDPLMLDIPQFGISVYALADVPDDDLGDVVDPADPPARELVVMDVAEPIRRLIWETNAEKDADPYGRTADPLAGHRLLTQEKTAASLALLHGETFVSVERWDQAGALVAVSEACVADNAAMVAEAEEAQARKRGKTQGVAMAAADEGRSAAQEAAKVQATAARALEILRKAKGDGWLSAAVIGQSMSDGQKGYLDTALASLVGRGQAETTGPQEYRPGRWTTKFRARG